MGELGQLSHNQGSVLSNTEQILLGTQKYAHYE